MKDEIVSMFEYGVWVNENLMDVAAELTPGQFKQKVLPSFGSVHLTLAHMVGADVLWFARWQGVSPKTMLSADELVTLSAIRSRWAEVVAQRRAYFAAIEETALTETAHWMNMRGHSYALPRWQVMLHCANHATHHRSEVAAILTALGHEPNSSDLLEFYLNRADQAWKPTG